MSDRLRRLGRTGRVRRLRALPGVATLELAGRRFLDDEMVDRAASLAYYGLLSLMPSLMILAGALRLLGTDTGDIDDLSGYLRDEGVSQSLAGTVESVASTAVGSGVAEAGTIGLVGLATLVYGASRVFGAAGRALDAIAGHRRTARHTVRRRVTDIGWTLLLLGLGVLALALTFVGQDLAGDVLDAVGLSSAGATIWSVLRWPAAVAAVMLAMQLVMWAAPSRRPRFRLVTVGSVVAASAWFAASIGYAIYIREIATYNATYGAFAALVILLLWIWLTSIAFLFGCEFDAAVGERREGRERERERADEG